MAHFTQNTPPNDRPIFFFSKTLSDTQKRYSTIQKELLAIVEAIKAFRVYLYGRFFILITDHRPLCYLFNMRDCSSRLFRQKMDLLDYNFKIIYRPGAQNKVADSLSRIEPLSIEELLEIEKEKVAFARIANLQNEQIIPRNSYVIDEKSGTLLRKSDFDMVFHLTPIENDILKDKLMNKFGIIKINTDFCKINQNHYAISISNQFSNRNNESTLRQCINKILKICEENGAEKIAINLDYDNLKHYLFFKEVFKEVFASSNISTSIFQNKLLEIQERDDIEMILKLFHQSILGGHVGAQRMEKTISQFYKWKNMSVEIRDFVRKCPVCEKTKVHTNVKVPMQISSLGEVAFDHTYIDFIGPIATSVNGSKYIFCATCDLCKYIVCVPTKDSTALTAARCLLEHIILKFNFPSRLISDNATSFLSKVISELTKLFLIKKIFTTAYHPQSNISERANKSIIQYVRAFVGTNKNHWDELLKYAEFVYNNTIHSTTGFTPHALVFGFSIRIPNHLTKPKVTYNYENLADIVRNNIAKSHELAKEYLYDRKFKNKSYYDKNASEYEINIGDQVLVKSQVKKHKFDNVYDGPYKVVGAKDVYVEFMRKGKRVKLHKNLLKKAKAEYDKDSSISIPEINLNTLTTELY